MNDAAIFTNVKYRFKEFIFDIQKKIPRLAWF